jgi:hypothetical protein
MNSSKVFTVDAANKTLVCEASDLKMDTNHSFCVKSAKTGKLAVFVVVGFKRDQEGEIIHWDYSPNAPTLVVCPELNGWKVVVFND